MTLLDKLRAADGPDRELDCAIELTLFGDKPFGHKGLYKKPVPSTLSSYLETFREDNGADDVPTDVVADYTASIDAALTLVPEGWNRRFSENDNGLWWAELRKGFETSYGRVILEGPHPTPALALCIAAIQAQE